jgi:RNA polymerase sigma-70 factor (ECF subfamily)
VRDDRRLVREYLAGGDVAFAALFDEHHAALFAFCYHLLGRRQEAEDLCQSAWLEAIRSLRSYRGRGSFRAWLHGIVLNLYRNHLRSRRPDPEPLSPDLPSEDKTSDPQQMAERQETTRRLRTALAQLEPAHREVVILHELQGFRYREIAHLLGCPVGTVKSRLHYGLLALRAALNPPMEVDHELHPRAAESEGLC